MIPFSASRLKVQYVRLRSVTTALGGSISIVDEKLSTKTKDVYTKMEMPLAIARGFMKRHAVRQYLKPVRAAVVMYDGRPVALERHPLGTLQEEKSWSADAETSIKSFLIPLCQQGNWYIDGTYVYSMPEFEAFGTSMPVSLDGRFRQINVKAFKLADLSYKELHEVEQRVCLMFETTSGDRSISPPIWKSLLTIGNSQFSKSGKEDIEDIGAGLESPVDITGRSVVAVDPKDRRDHFNRIDELLCVNLGFIIKAGRELTDVFGYDSIEPLNLPALMLRLKTVNLPNVSNAVKQTYDSGLPFTHAVAWLIGLLRRVETLDAYLVIRSLLKHLSTKGVYRKNAFDVSRVFRQGFDINNVPLLTPEEAEAAVLALTMSDLHKNYSAFNDRNRGFNIIDELENSQGNTPID